MKINFNVFLILFFALISVGVFAQYDITAEEIIKRADEKMRGKTNTSTMEMQIIRPTWKRSVTMKSWGRGMDYSMTYITAPAKEKGQVFMKRKTEMWNWMPSISRMIKIPASMMSQGWMGSDYSNDDILKESSIVHDYNHKIVGEEKMEGFDTYKIEMIPKEEAAVIWGKIYKWISKDDEYIQVRSEYYDEDDELIKSDFAYDFKTMDGRLIPTRIEIIPADEEGKKTVLYIKNIKFDVDLPESFFSQQKMKKIR
ncbi:MAG: outer membrane lipoprotein-sorting protein [Bacteroidetes bacterium]|nr:MAG: outer membrane lipoprotein-sorting protein [Bacteroidota bacterium]